MKLRLLPVLLTFFISAAVLFGGWFTYQSMAVENPISKIARGIEGVADAQIDSGGKELNIRLELEEGADLSTIYKAIREKSEKEIGSRTLNIEIVSESSAELDRFWATALFDVAQAMDTRRYGDIPVRLKELSAGKQGLTIDTAMDEENVYVSLHMNGKSKYVVLPRTPLQVGVWPNEQVQ